MHIIAFVPWCQVVVCANTPEEQQELLEVGCDAIYCNQNAWLDYHTLFTLKLTESALSSHHGRPKRRAFVEVVR